MRGYLSRFSLVSVHVLGSLPGQLRSGRRGRAISYLGIDVGGTKVSLLLETQSGPDEDTFRWPATRNAGEDLALLAERIRLLLGPRLTSLGGVGVAMPATCDAAGLVRTWPGRPSWAGVDIGAFLRKVFPGAPAVFADDGDVAALAEARAAGCGNLIYLGVGTGIGGGIVHDGSLFPGLARGSAEVGHLIVDRNGPRCDCGRSGCVQAVASGPATLRRAARLCGRDTGPADLAAGVRNGKDWALAAVGESASALASAVVGICELAHPELVVIGGGFAAGIPDFAAEVGEHAARLARAGSDLVPIRPATLGARSSLHGAVLLAARERGFC